MVATCNPDLEAWDENIRPGAVLNCGETITALADRPGVDHAATAWGVIERVQHDLREFRDRHRLDQVIVVNVASTEPAAQTRPETASLDRLECALNNRPSDLLPVSSLYAFAAIDGGLPYINFTPSAGASFPAFEELAERRGVPIAGKDGKTGETLLKTVLAPMFAPESSPPQLGRAQHSGQLGRASAQRPAQQGIQNPLKGSCHRRHRRLPRPDTHVDRVHRILGRLENGVGPHSLPGLFGRSDVASIHVAGERFGFGRAACD